MPNTHFVFDLDGTLVESLPGIAQAINRALSKLGKTTHSQQAIRAMIGQGVYDLCTKALNKPADSELSDAELQEMVAAFAQEYATCLQGEGTLVISGMIRTLSKLSAKGCQLAVLSNKPQEPTQQIVNSLFKSIPFSHVIGFEKGRFPRKPDPASLHYIAEQWGIDISQITLVGDSIHDAHTAENAGCQLALVAWGYCPMTTLKDWKIKHPETHLVGTVEDLTHNLLGSTKFSSIHV